MKYFLSRQAIFNNRLEVLGYDLRFESGFDGMISQAREEDRAPEQAISKLFFSIGIENDDTPVKAYIPFTKNLLSERMADLFPPEQLGVIFKIPDETDQSVFDECLRLKRKGYIIILEHFNFTEKHLRFLQSGSILRIPSGVLLNMDGQKLNKILQNGVELLADQVNSNADMPVLRELGIHYFQGDFFSKAQPLAGKEIPGFKIAYLQLMKEILQPDIEFKRIEEIVIKDVSLSYKLLKMVNTAAFGFRKEITSIRQALVIIGAREIRKWVSLVTVNHLGDDKSDELFKKALFRGRFCEMLAPKVGLSSKASDLFLLGMFSLIDAFVDQPLEKILSGLPLSDEIKQTLAGEETKYAPVFNLVLSYEKGNWQNVFSTASHLHIEQDELPQLYFSTVEWVLQIFE